LNGAAGALVRGICPADEGVRRSTIHPHSHSIVPGGFDVMS
jgi:hypothetical protein